MTTAVKTLRSSITDGIALVPRYRERQLSALHRSLVARKQTLVQSTIDAFEFTRAEALAEYLQVLNAIKTYHSKCDPLACNEAEYATARSEDDLERRAPAGYVHVIPSNESLYNTILPVAAAVAAGNVILVQRSPRKSALNGEIEQALTQALSAETFAYVDRDPFDPKYQQSRGVVFEGQATPNAFTSTRRICCPSLGVVAVVDRSASVKDAARDLVRARFGFGGSSSYAPDLVLVNEFRIKEFSEAVADAGLKFLSQSYDSAIGSQTSKRRASRSSQSDAEESGHVLMSGYRGKVVLLRAGTSPPIDRRLVSPTLLVLPVSSMDNAIDLLNQAEQPLAANFVYAAPASAKYITQFVKAAASFVNHVPTELLIGGLAPNGWQLSAHPRYTPEMFSQPSPILTITSERSKTLAALVTHSDAKQQRRLEKALDATLVPVKEPWGPMFGFFEQGFLFNAGFILSSLAVGTFCSVKYGYPALISTLSHST